MHYYQLSYEIKPLLRSKGEGGKGLQSLPLHPSPPSPPPQKKKRKENLLVFDQIISLSFLKSFKQKGASQTWIQDFSHYI